METRANYLIVGFFVIAVIILGIFVVLFGFKSDSQDKKAFYDIFFQGEVSGLSVAGDVKFNGIRVGKVQDLKIDPFDPDRVQVRVEIDEDTPVREDSVASLAPQGITGVSYVSITGGSRSSPRLKAKDDQEVPVIQSRRGGLSEAALLLPDMIQQASETIKQIRTIIDENREGIKSIIIGVDTAVADLPEAMEKVTVAFDEIGEAGKKINKLIDQVSALRTDFKRTLVSITKLSDNLNKVVTESRPGIVNFSKEGLASFERLTKDIRQTVRNIDRFFVKLESDPNSLIFGRKVPEYNTRRK